MTKFVPSVLLHGVLSQSALGKIRNSDVGFGANGLLVRAGVLRTYYADQAQALPQPPNSTSGTNRNPTRRTASEETKTRHHYVDVLAYSGLAGVRKRFIPKVLVTQSGGGVHTGEVWVPREARINISNETLLSDIKRINPGDLDGDHVLIGFMDDDFRTPVVVCSIPHPSRDKGADTAPNAYSTRFELGPVQTDVKFPRYTIHNGATWGIDEAGNFIINIARAHTGTYDRKGREPRLPGDPSSRSDLVLPLDGSSGNLEMTMRQGSRMSLKVLTDPANPTSGSTEYAEIALEDGKITLGVKEKTAGATPSRITIEETDVTIDAKADAGQVIVRGATADLQTSFVNLGDGASHPVLKGDTYNTSHAAMDSALSALIEATQAVVTQINILLPLMAAKLSPPPIPGDPILTGLNTLSLAVSAMTSATGNATAALTQFDGVDAPGALSTATQTR